MPEDHVRRRLPCLVLPVALFLAPVVSVAQSPQADVSDLRLPDGTGATKATHSLPTPGEIGVWVKLVDPPLAVAVGPDAKKVGAKLNGAQQRKYLQDLKQKQDSLMGQIRNLGGREIARVSKAYNALAVAMTAPNWA